MQKIIILILCFSSLSKCHHSHNNDYDTANNYNNYHSNNYFSNYDSSNPERPYKYTSYQTTTQCSHKVQMKYPENIEQIVDIIKMANLKGLKVKPIGNFHSITDIICTDGIPISLKKIKKIKINKDEFTVTVGSGVELVELASRLDKVHRALEHIPTYGGITIGGAISVGAHGSTLLHPSTLSEQVVKMTIVDGEGIIRVITRDDEDMKAFKVSLGLLGIIVDVTLRIVNQFKFDVRNELTSDDILTNGEALNMAEHYDWFQIWWFPSREKCVVSKGKQVKLEKKGDAYSNLYPEIHYYQNRPLGLLFEEYQSTDNYAGLLQIEEFYQNSLYRTVAFKEPYFTENKFLINNPAVGLGHKIMMNKCKDCWWSSLNGTNREKSIYPEEFAFAFNITEFTSVVNSIKSILKDLKAVFPFNGIFIRFSQQYDGLMASESERRTVHIDITTPMRSNPFVTSKYGLAALQAISQAMAFKHDGIAHWGKNGAVYHTRERIEKTHLTNIQKFRDAMIKYDPRGVFLNNFGKRVLGISDEREDDKRVKFCAIQDYCICQESSHCAFEETCSDYNGFNVCKKKYSEVL